MTIRTIHPEIKEALIENDALKVFHLVKFQKPSQTPLENEDLNFVYLTDSFHEVEYEGNTYVPGGLFDLGNVREETEAKATSLSLTLSAAKLGAHASVAITNTEILAENTGTLTVNLDLFSSGFYPGDTVILEDSSLNTYQVRIDRLYGKGTKIDITALETLPENSSVVYTVRYSNPEVTSLTSSKSSLSYSNYVNRVVTIYRVFQNSSTEEVYGEPILYFRGIISKSSVQDKMDGNALITWNLTSDWGDFVRVQGRTTSDEEHRALNSAGVSNPEAALKPEYASDKGFEHSDSSLNAMANYTAMETKLHIYKSGGVFAGGRQKVKEIPIEVNREMNLSINLESRYLPVVYGVQKIESIPVFADVVVYPDTNSENNSADGYTELYMANALCEGQIGGILNIYKEDTPLVCVNEADSASRTENGSFGCIGRMDTGAALGGTPYWQIAYNYVHPRTGKTIDPQNYAALQAVINSTEDTNNQNGYSVPFVKVPNPEFQTTLSSNAGLQHGQTFSSPSAQIAGITFYAGKENQEADETLTRLSQGEDFLIQKNYYKSHDISQYWSSEHRLLDTAYVVTSDKITEEDGKSSDFKYIVKGKYINCHNYDGTYRIVDDKDLNDFNLGDAVTISLDNGAVIDSGMVIDKFSFIDVEGKSDVRIRFKADTDAVDNRLLNNEVGRFVVTKDSTATSYTFQSELFTGNPSNPQEVAPKYSFGSLVTDTGFSNISTTLELTRTDSVSTGEGDTGVGGISDDLLLESEYVSSFRAPVRAYRPAGVNEYFYKYSISLNSLSSTSKDILRALKEIGENKNSNTGRLNLTINDGTSTAGLPVDNTNILVDGNNLSLVWNSAIDRFIPFFSATYTSGVAQSVNITLSLKSDYLYYKNASDPRSVLNLEGTVLEITRARTFLNSVGTRTTTTYLPETVSYRNLFDTENILALGFSSFDKDTATYQVASSTVAVTEPENSYYGDFRVSNNPAWQLLDYMTSNRYGKGISMESIDLDSFKQTARACDQQSDVTILAPVNTQVSVGDVYKYEGSGNLVFQGTVSDYGLKEYNGFFTYQITFTNVIGKLGHKYYSWKSYEAGDILWDTDGTFKKVTSAGTQLKPVDKTDSITIQKVSGSEDSNNNISVETSKQSPEGNPLVKKLEPLPGSTDLTLLSGYSLYDADQVIYWKYVGWDAQEQRYATRHQMNIVIDTAQSMFNNINSMLMEFNGILRYSNGKYSLSLKTKAKDIDQFDEAVEVITDDLIVGDIKLEDKGITKTYNAISTSIIDPSNNFEGRSLSFANSIYKAEDNGIPRKGNYKAAGITNYFNARMNIKQALDESRSGLQVSFTIAPQGYLLLAGEVVAITYPRFNWEKKLFRIESLTVQKNLLVSIIAEEYNDDAYIIEPLQSSIFEKYQKKDDSFKAPNVIRPPVNLSASADGNGGVELTWNNTGLYNRTNYTVQVWRSEDNNFDNASIIGYSKSDEFIDPVVSGNLITRYYWIRYAVFQTKEASNTGASKEFLSPFYPVNTGPGVAGSAAPPKDGSNIDIRIDASNGTVFKNNEGSTILKATVLENGSELSDIAHNSMTYSWTDGQEGVLCVTSLGREVIDDNGVPLIATGSAGSLSCTTGVPADSSEPANPHGSSLREIVLGAEDVTDKQTISVIVGNIPD